MIFYSRICGDLNASKSLVSLDVVGMFYVREESRLAFFTIHHHSVEPGRNTRDGHQIAMYYRRVFGLLDHKSLSHFLYNSNLECYAMKPNAGLIRIYRVLHVVDMLRTSLGGDFCEEEKGSGCLQGF